MGFNLQQFIEKAAQREMSKLKYGVVFVPFFEMDIPLKKIGTKKFFEIMGEVDEDNLLEAIEAQKTLIYESMPILADEEIQLMMKGKEPDEIVYELFTVEEIGLIADRIAKLNNVDVDVEEVKNESEQMLKPTTGICSLPSLNSPSETC